MTPPGRLGTKTPSPLIAPPAASIPTMPCALRLSLALTALMAAPIVPDLHAQEHTKVVTGGDRWGANWFPNYELTNQDGKVMRFFDDCIKDRVVLISFIYTSCPDACPLETARIAQVQGILGDRVGQDVFFYSITIDPDNDTPEVLKEYAQRYQAGPGWQFLTGKESEIATLRMKLGLYRPGEEQSLQDHGLNIIIGNQSTGRWMRSGPFENPYVLARQIGDWLHNWKLPPTERLDYKDAPELRKISDGEALFRTRCSSCHAIGGANAALAKLGPNLFGVTERRERQWLMRWIMEPDVMLAEKDPIAMPMFEAYNKVPMPNMRLTAQETERLMEYLRTESQRAATVLPTLTGEDGQTHEASASCCQKSDQVVVGDEAAPGGGDLRLAAGAEDAAAGWAISPLMLAAVALGSLLGALTWALGRRSLLAQG